MTNKIQIQRKQFIDQLSSIKHDNVDIAGIVINRAKLIQALKLQTQPLADVLTINYGNLSWHYDYQNHEDGTWEYEPYTKEPEPCIQITCDHTVMRFLNRPKNGYAVNVNTKHLNFIDHETTQSEIEGIPLDSQELLRALNFVLPCIAPDDSRPVLTCVLLDCGNDIIKLVSADGFRLGIASVKAQGITTDKFLIEPKELYTFLKSIKPIGKGKHKYFPKIKLILNKDTATFAYEMGEINLERQLGTFPDYAQLIPPTGTHIQFIASDMLQAVKALSVIARDSSGIIRLRFQTDNLVGKVILSSQSEDLGDLKVECDAKVESDAKIGIDQKYLIELLRLCGDNLVDMSLTMPDRPMLFTLDTRQSVIMPMFVQWESKSETKEPEPEIEESPEPMPEEIEETVNDEVLVA